MKTQGADGNYKPRREAWNRPSLAVRRRNCPCPQPWILASRPAQLGDDTSLSFAPCTVRTQRGSVESALAPSAVSHLVSKPPAASTPGQ